jgi:hypothetical protein
MFMCRFFTVVGVIVVCVIGAGFYFGYFRLGSDSADGKTHITLTIDQKEFGHSSKE